MQVQIYEGDTIVVSYLDEIRCLNNKIRDEIINQAPLTKIKQLFSDIQEIRRSIFVRRTERSQKRAA